MTDKLDEVMDRSHQYDNQMERLFSKVRSTLKQVTEQTKNATQISVKSLHYARLTYLKDLDKKKTRNCLEAWRALVNRRKLFKVFIKKALKHIHHVPAQHYLRLWHSNTKAYENSGWKRDLQNLSKRLHQHEITVQGLEKT